MKNHLQNLNIKLFVLLVIICKLSSYTQTRKEFKLICSKTYEMTLNTTGDKSEFRLINDGPILYFSECSSSAGDPFFMDDDDDQDGVFGKRTCKSDFADGEDNPVYMWCSQDGDDQLFIYFRQTVNKYELKLVTSSSFTDSYVQMRGQEISNSPCEY